MHILMGFVLLLNCGAVQASNNGKSGAEPSGWIKTIKEHKNLAIMAGMGVGALAFNQLVIAPFLVSVIGGFASEAFVLDNPNVQNFITDKSRDSRVPLEFMRGMADGGAYYALSKLGRVVFPWLNGIPMTAGLIVGQAAGIAFNNRPHA